MGSIPDLAALHLWWYRYRIISRRSHVLSERLIPLSLPLFLKGVKSHPVHGEPRVREEVSPFALVQLDCEPCSWFHVKKNNKRSLVFSEMTWIPLRRSKL